MNKINTIAYISNLAGQLSQINNFLKFFEQNRTYQELLEFIDKEKKRLIYENKKITK